MQYSTVYVQHHDAFLPHVSLLLVFVLCSSFTFFCTSFLSPFSVSSIQNHSTLWLIALYTTMHGHEHLPRTHANHHANSEISVQDAFCPFYSILHNSLCYPEVGIRLLNYYDASPALSKPELLNLSFTVSLSLPEAPAGFESVYELLGINCSPYFDPHLFFMQVIYLMHSHDIYPIILSESTSSVDL